MWAATLGGEAAQGEAAADVGGGGGAGGYESPVDEASEGWRCILECRAAV